MSSPAWTERDNRSLARRALNADAGNRPETGVCAALLEGSCRFAERAALLLLRDMSTFEDAGISDAGA